MMPPLLILNQSYYKTTEMKCEIAEKSEIFSGSIQYVTISFVNERRNSVHCTGEVRELPL